MEINYNQKLKPIRHRTSTVKDRCFNEEMESDRGRSINSAAVRRLQQKTQVFPLEKNAAVRSRLTHSLEVQQVGRHISKSILKEFERQGLLENFGLDTLKEGFVSAVEMACLLHDIGNPPFGHFGEEAIKKWVEKSVSPILKDQFACDAEHQKYDEDLRNFEGNAQGLRVLHSTQKLNLTYTQLACLIKYTRPAYEKKPEDGSSFLYRKKKPGYYLSEKKLYDSLTKELSIDAGHRFPLTYIMEAADDISYCIADVADAVDKGILSIDKLDFEIRKEWKEVINNKAISDKDKEYLIEVADSALSRSCSDPDKKHTYILTLRTTLVNDLVKSVTTNYIDNHKQIFNGEYDGSLVGGKDVYSMAASALKNVAIKNVFNYHEVENLELKGYAAITGLLGIYLSLLHLKSKDFIQLAQQDNLKGFPVETRLYHKLSNKHKLTYVEVVSGIDVGDNCLEEFYYRVRLIIDYVSGMTDGYALDEYKMLSAAV